MEIFDLAFFKDLPKADLHCHLDGSLRLTTLIDLAKEQNIPLPSDDPVTLKKKLGFGQLHDSLEDYLKIFDITCSVMQTAAAIYRIAYELVVDAAKENIWHIEIRFCPTFLTKKGLNIEQVIEAAIKGAKDAGEKHQVSTGIILCAMRMFDPKVNLEIAKAAVLYKNKGVLALDLAGPEVGYPSRHHAASFFHVISNYMNITIHAGEADSHESIAEALHYSHAQRIGHGTRLFENPELLNYMVNQQIPLEVCLSSNLQTRVVDDLSKHPARLYLDAGIRVTLNTDNRLISDTTLSHEYELAYNHLKLTPNEIKTLIFNGFRSAFLPHQKKNELLERVFSCW